MLLPAEGFRAFPEHESRNAEIDDDRNDADNEVDVTGSFERLNQLRAHFRAGDGADCHEKTEAQIDVAECTVTLRCHHRFADDVGQIGADSKIPVYAGEAQRWSGNKTSAHAEEPTEKADDEADYDEIDRINVRL